MLKLGFILNFKMGSDSSLDVTLWVIKPYAGDFISSLMTLHSIHCVDYGFSCTLFQSFSLWLILNWASEVLSVQSRFQLWMSWWPVNSLNTPRLQSHCSEITPYFYGWPFAIALIDLLSCSTLNVHSKMPADSLMKPLVCGCPADRPCRICVSSPVQQGDH